MANKKKVDDPLAAMVARMEAEMASLRARLDAQSKVPVNDSAADQDRQKRQRRKPTPEEKQHMTEHSRESALLAAEAVRKRAMARYEDNGNNSIDEAEQTRIGAALGSKYLTLDEKLRLAFDQGIFDLSSLSRHIRVPIPQIEARMAELHREGKVVNVGGDLDPQYVWKVGTDVPPAYRRQVMLSVLKIKPMEIKEVVEATALGQAPVNNTMMEFRRNPERWIPAGYKLVDLGTTRSGRYFLQPVASREIKHER